MLFVRFLTFATGLANVNNAQPSLSDVLINKTQANVSEYLTLLGQHQDFFDLISSPPDAKMQTGLTLLIPNNDAFGKIPYSGLSAAFKNNNTDTIRSVLEYHVLNGSHSASSVHSSFSFPPTWLDNSTYTNVTAGQVVGAVQQSPGVNIFTSGLGSRSTLVTSDLEYANGLVHVIDTFLTPPTGFLATAAQFNLTAFAGALVKTNLLGMVSTTPDITIFCPTNAAFETLGSTLESMSSPALEALLRYHIVTPNNNNKISKDLPSNGPAYSPHLQNKTHLPTILSQSDTPTSVNVTITTASNSLYVNAALITQLDILLANGVLHIIDDVLSPNDTLARPVAGMGMQVPVLGVGAGGFENGSSSMGGEVPFTAEFPATATAVMTSAVTLGAGATESFGVADVGMGTTKSTAADVSGAETGGGGAAATSSAMATMTMMGGAEMGGGSSVLLDWGDWMAVLWLGFGWGLVDGNMFG